MAETYLKTELVYNGNLSCWVIYALPRTWSPGNWKFNLLKPTGYVMHQQFNIQQLYVLPTLYLCAWYLSENKQ